MFLLMRLSPIFYLAGPSKRGRKFLRSGRQGKLSSSKWTRAASDVIYGMIFGMTKTRKRIVNILIVVWIALFHYEALRLFYLQDPLKISLPKTPFLFPAQGWVMFFNMADSWSTVEVYGARLDEAPERIDPKSIFSTNFPGFDAIRRNTLMTVLRTESRAPFCERLKRKFPEYETFLIMHAGHGKVAPELSPKEYIRPSFRC